MFILDLSQKGEKQSKEISKAFMDMSVAFLSRKQ